MPNVPVPAAASGLPASRRGFLRSLTALPLIGGGLSLVGKPSAVAVPVTAELRTRYLGWLAREYAEALVEREFFSFMDAGYEAGSPHVAAYLERKRHGLRYMTESYCGYECPPVPSAPPSTRAALVLSAVGADWKGGNGA